MATNVRIKVAVADLIKVIEAKKAKAERAAAREEAKFAEKFAAYKVKMIAWANGLTGDDDYIRQPQKPYRNSLGSVSRYDRDIALLKMSSEDTITVTGSSDFYRYIGE